MIINIMTNQQRAIQIVQERDAAKMIRFLNELEAKGIDTRTLPTLCDSNACGHEGQDWARDLLEEWQNSNLDDDQYES